MTGFGGGLFGGGLFGSPAAGLGSLQILLDDFTGAFPYDITVYQEGDLTFSRGRPDEFAEVSAGDLSLTLDNTDGRFTPGSGTYTLGLDQPIRVIVNGVTMWTGYVQSWPVSWPGGSQSYSTVTVSAFDAFARMGRTPLRSAVEEDILVDHPAATYPLSEAALATTAADKSGNGGSPLAIVGTGTAMTFGAGIGPIDGLTCAQFNGGMFLRNGIPQVFIPAGSAFTLECYFATTATPASGAVMMALDDGGYATGNGIAYLGISSAGKLFGQSNSAPIISSPSVNDGLVHHAVLTVSAGGSVTLYLDGVSVGTSAGSTQLADSTRLSVAPSDNPIFATPFVGTIAHVSIYTAVLSAARAVVKADGRNDHTGETPQGRFARIAAYCGIATGSLDTTGNTVLGAATQDGRTALDILNETADATLGFVYLDGLGRVSSINGYTLAANSSIDVTLDAAYADGTTVIENDMAGVINEATGGSTSSENTFTATNAASKARHGLYRQDFTWNVNSDAQAADRTGWIVSRHAGSAFFSNPTPRVSSLRLDINSMTTTDTTAAMTLDVGKYLFLTNLPTQALISGVNFDLVVQGIAWTVSPTEFSVTLNCNKRQDYNGWILNNSLYGVLDSTSTLYGA